MKKFYKFFFAKKNGAGFALGKWFTGPYELLLS